MDVFRRKSNGGMNSLLQSSSANSSADEQPSSGKKSSESPSRSSRFLGGSSSKQPRDSTHSTSRPSLDQQPTPAAASFSLSGSPSRSILPSLPPINLSPFSFPSSSPLSSASSLQPTPTLTSASHHPTRSQSISVSQFNLRDTASDTHTSIPTSPMVRSASSPLQGFHARPTTIPLNDEPSPSPSSFRSASYVSSPMLSTPLSSSSTASSRAIRKAASIESFHHLSSASSPRSRPTPPFVASAHDIDEEILLNHDDHHPRSSLHSPDPSSSSNFSGLGLGTIDPPSWSNLDRRRRIKKSSVGGGVTVSMVAHLKAGRDGLDLDEYDSEAESERSEDEGKRRLLDEEDDEENRVEVIWQQSPRLRQYGDGPGDEDSAESDLSEEEVEEGSDPEGERWERHGQRDRSDDLDTTPHQIRVTSDGLPRTTSSFNIHPSPPKIITQPSATSTVTVTPSTFPSSAPATITSFRPNVYDPPPAAVHEELSPFGSMLAQSQEEVIWEARRKLFSGRSVSGNGGGGEGMARVAVSGASQSDEKDKDGKTRSRSGSSGEAVPLVEEGNSRTSSLLSPSKREPHVVPLAVVGHAGVGKTTLIKRAFKGWEVGETETIDLEDGMTIEVRTTRCLLKPNTYGNVRLYEIPLTAFNLSNGRIEWPPTVPSPEAVMLCYDAGVKSSFDGILRFLSLKDPDLPYLVCGLKSAGVPRPVELPAAQVAEKVGKHVCSISVEDDKTTRFMHKGFSFLMREAHNRRRGPSSPNHVAYQDTTSSTSEHPSPSPHLTPRPPALRILTTSSATDPSILDPGTLPSLDAPSSSSRLSCDSFFSETSQQRLANEVCWHPSPPLGGQLALPEEGRGENGHTKGASSMGSHISEGKRSALGLGTEGAGGTAGREELLTEVERNREAPSEGLTGSKKRRGSSSPKEQTSGGGFFTLPDLMSLLFYHLLMGDDPFFVQTFLWIFRRFTRPFDLITAIHKQLLILDDKKLGLGGVTAQMRICKFLTDWWHAHRSDFATLRTKEVLLKTHAYIIGQHPLAHYEDRFGRFWLKELKALDDAHLPWAISDHERSPQPSPTLESKEQAPSSRQMNIQVSVERTQTVSISHTSSTTSLNSIAESPISSTASASPSASAVVPSTTTKPRPPTLIRQSHSNHSFSNENSLPSSPSSATNNNTSARNRRDSDVSRRSNSSSPAAFSSMDNLTKSSSRTSNTSGTGGTGSSPALPLSIGGGGGKSAFSRPGSAGGGAEVDLWDSPGLARMAKRFLEASDRQIAEDITRMEWELFIEVEPRGLMTYVLNGGHDQACSRIAQHFNNLSSLFSYLVLSQPKLKTRAKIYERTIRITHLVRSHSNYMSLTSIMAAMSEYFILGLHSTRALAREVLETEVDSLGRDTRMWSRFQSHEKLVAPKGNYKYYRKAIEADLGNSREVQLIPIFPVICSDITRVNVVYHDRKDGSSGPSPSPSFSPINWTKFEKYGELLHFVKNFQNRGCPVPRGSTSATGMATPNVVKLMLADKPPIASDSILSVRSKALENPDGGSGDGPDGSGQRNFSSAFNKLMARARSSRDQ